MGTFRISGPETRFSDEIRELLWDDRGRWYCDPCLRALTGAEATPSSGILLPDYQRAYDTRCTHCSRYRTCTRARPAGFRASPRKRVTAGNAG